MRLDDLKAFILANIGPFIAARSTPAIPLSGFSDATVVLREWKEPSQEKLLFLDPQPDQVEAGTNRVSYVTETIDAYVIVTRGAKEETLREQAKGYLAALVDCMKTHPDYMEFRGREYYDGIEGKPDGKGAKTTLVFGYEE
jgi:hypothetical protein